jgi:hypothetical protein
MQIVLPFLLLAQAQHVPETSEFGNSISVLPQIPSALQPIQPLTPALHKRATAGQELVLYKRQPIEFIQRPIRGMYDRLETLVAKTVADTMKRPQQPVPNAKVPPNQPAPKLPPVLDQRPWFIRWIPDAFQPQLQAVTMNSVRLTVRTVCDQKNGQSQFYRDLGRLNQNQLVALHPESNSNFLLRWALHLVFNILCLLRKYS